MSCVALALSSGLLKARVSDLGRPPMADESMTDKYMADEFKVMADNTIPRRREYVHTYMYISYEILKYRRKRNACNIYGGEILKYRRKRST